MYVVTAIVSFRNRNRCVLQMAKSATRRARMSLFLTEKRPKPHEFTTKYTRITKFPVFFFVFFVLFVVRSGWRVTPDGEYYCVSRGCYLKALEKEDREADLVVMRGIA